MAMKFTRTKFEALPEDASDDLIESTAASLERHPYTPLMILEVPNFLRWRKNNVLDEFDRLLELPHDAPELKAVIGQEPTTIIEKQLGFLYYHYELLCRLRLSDAHAWDVVHELYEDD